MYTLNTFQGTREISNFKNKVQIYSVVNLPQTEEKYRLLSNIAEELEKQYHVTFLSSCTREGDFLLALSGNPIGKTLPHPYLVINYQGENFLSVFREPLRNFIYRLCREKLENYRLWRRAYNKYYEPLPEKIVDDNYEIYRGVFFRIDFLGNKILLTIDPISTVAKKETVKEYISKVGLEAAKSFFKSEKGRRARYVIAEKITMKHLRSKALKKVLALRSENATTPLFIIKDQPYSIKSYYRDYLRLHDIADLIDDDEHVIEVDEGLRSGFYASSLCKLIVRTDEVPYEDRPKLRPEIFLKPHSRLKLTEKFLGIISPLYHSEVGEIGFDSKMLSSGSFVEGTLNSPFVSFYKKDAQVNYDEYGYFFRSNLKTFGPKVRKAFPPTKQIVLVHPEYMPDALARTFYLDICRIAKLYFKMVLPSRPILWRYPELNIEDHFYHYKNKVGAVLFVVKDEYDAENYYQFKRIFQDVPNQAVTYNLINLKWSAKNDSERSLYRNALINITSGLLGKIGTRPWLLREKLSCNLYVGIDVGGLTATVLNLVVMDDMGNYLFDSWKPLSGIKASEGDIKSFIKQILHKFPMISQITIHKDGELFKEEIEGVINAVKEHGSSISLIFVAVKKNVPFRIYKQVNNSFYNTPLGAYFVFNENAALIATIGEPILKQGMARPLLIEIDPASSKYDILSVLKDIYYLSFMHWGSLVAKTKLPATIKYADDLAGYAEHGIRAPSPPL